MGELAMTEEEKHAEVIQLFKNAPQEPPAPQAPTSSIMIVGGNPARDNLSFVVLRSSPGSELRYDISYTQTCVSAVRITALQGGFENVVANLTWLDWTENLEEPDYAACEEMIVGSIDPAYRLANFIEPLREAYARQKASYMGMRSDQRLSTLATWALNALNIELHSLSMLLSQRAQPTTAPFSPGMDLEALVEAVGRAMRSAAALEAMTLALDAQATH